MAIYILRAFISTNLSSLCHQVPVDAISKAVRLVSDRNSHNGFILYKAQAKVDDGKISILLLMLIGDPTSSVLDLHGLTGLAKTIRKNRLEYIIIV